MTDARPHLAPEGKIWVCMTCFNKRKDIADFRTAWCCEEVVLCDEVQPAPGFYAVSSPAD